MTVLQDTPPPYLPTGEAQHGLHHGHPLPVLQRIEGTVVLQGRQVLLLPRGRHLSRQLGLHLMWSGGKTSGVTLLWGYAM